MQNRVLGDAGVITIGGEENALCLRLSLSLSSVLVLLLEVFDIPHISGCLEKGDLVGALADI